MTFKKMLTLVLAMSLVLCLCACGSKNTQGEEADTTASVQEVLPDENGNVTYTVTVEDESGDPVSGAMLLLKAEATIPNGTNEEGVATYTVPKADYTVSFVSVPAGYATNVEEYAFPDGEYELVITLKSI